MSLTSSSNCNECISACLERAKSNCTAESGRGSLYDETRRTVLLDTILNGGFDAERALSLLNSRGLLQKYRRYMALEIDNPTRRGVGGLHGFTPHKSVTTDAYNELSEKVLTKLLKHSLKTMGGQPLVRAKVNRTVTRIEDAEGDPEHRDPLISMEDVYSALVSAEGNACGDFIFSDMSVSLKTATITELRKIYALLDPNTQSHNIGAADTDSIDDCRLSMLCSTVPERKLEGRALIDCGSDPGRVRRFLAGGAPAHLRLALWALSLDSEVGTAELNDIINRAIPSEDWITDDIIRNDAEEKASDANYFPFEELIETLSLVLSRDPWVKTHAVMAPHKSIIPDDDKLIDSVDVTIPPCSHIPFEGWTCLACPFSYLGEALSPTLYGVYRAFYCRYWVRLLSIELKEGIKDSLAYLAILCENLVLELAPELVFRCRSTDRLPSVLKIALPWILSGFVGYIRPAQLLLLYDRIIAFDTVELVAILAAAVILFQKEALMVADTVEEVATIFSNMDYIQAIPLIQGLIFGKIPHEP
ncbi:hypothetical protein FOL47_007415 [Perkinsus chesapeaki]|uniref:Rab-GAP TBC domain-containing protein n=1 Tax=Perkinsus chesapeaki TaxID=330153 RepID=A0A7J6LKM7_PERCH|nr:hypothetical protein FOL47_007415 [Perkinsus chesapeaki]